MATQEVANNKPLFSENWRNLQKILAEEKAASGSITENKIDVANPRKRKHPTETNTYDPKNRSNVWKKRRAEIKRAKTTGDSSGKTNAEVTKVLGLDCEYVGVGVDGSDNMLARVSIVNEDGEPIYDKYVKPTQRITDFRTALSGIRPHNLDNGLPFSQVQSEVSKLIAGRIVVGHAIHNDFKVLNISHPRKLTRDTFKYPLLRQAVNKKAPSLKLLSKEILGITIQEGEHDSVSVILVNYGSFVVDARVALKLYLLHKKKWENDLRKMFR
uniref:RNA exonuclease 4 n=1 Tax=Syphacia muris TaxID=451379 RepID=A0A0N5AGL4_9BILA